MGQNSKVKSGGVRLTPEKDEDVRLMQTAVLAFMGDAVFNLFIRERLIKMKKGTSHRLHKLATDYVKASSQARISKFLLSTFNEDEAYIFKRGRNTKSTTIPKNADVQDYRYATAFEALLGYLYLTGRFERLNIIMEQAAQIIEQPEMGRDNGKE